METKTFEITEYKYGFLNSTALKDRRMVAHLYEKGDLVAIAYFQKELSDPRLNNRGIINLFYTMEDSLGFIDMLRNEKPVFLHFVPQPEEAQAFISTSLEPIGEGE